MKKNNEIFRIAGKIIKLKKKAEKLGIFLDDRELLECKKCGLMEDVNSYGVLLTVFKNEPLRDTDLRFKKIKGKNRHFQCPNCDEILVLSEKGTGYEKNFEVTICDRFNKKLSLRGAKQRSDLMGRG